MRAPHGGQPGAGIQIWSWCGRVCLCVHMYAHVHGLASIAMKGCVREKGVSLFKEELERRTGKPKQWDRIIEDYGRNKSKLINYQSKCKWIKLTCSKTDVVILEKQNQTKTQNLKSSSVLSPELRVQRQEKVERKRMENIRQPKAGCHINLRLHGLEAFSGKDGSRSNEDRFISPRWQNSFKGSLIQ